MENEVHNKFNLRMFGWKFLERSIDSDVKSFIEVIYNWLLFLPIRFLQSPEHYKNFEELIEFLKGLRYGVEGLDYRERRIVEMCT